VTGGEILGHGRGGARARVANHPSANAQELVKPKTHAPSQAQAPCEVERCETQALGFVAQGGNGREAGRVEEGKQHKL